MRLSTPKAVKATEWAAIPAPIPTNPSTVIQPTVRACASRALLIEADLANASELIRHEDTRGAMRFRYSLSDVIR
jgi:hypothetical protein